MNRNVKNLPLIISDSVKDLLVERDRKIQQIDRDFIDSVILKIAEKVPSLESLTLQCTQKQELAFLEKINNVSFAYLEWQGKVVNDELKSKLIECNLTLEEFRWIYSAFHSLSDTVSSAYFPKFYDDYGILVPTPFKIVKVKISPNQIEVFTS